MRDTRSQAQAGNKLFRRSRRPARVAHLPLDRLGTKTIPVQGNPRLLRHPLHQLQELRLVQRQVGYAQAEAVGQGGLLLNGLTGVTSSPARSEKVCRTSRRRLEVA